jgi:hypothetical protein
MAFGLSDLAGAAAKSGGGKKLLDILGGGTNVVGMGLQVLGGVGKMIGANEQRKEAENQLNRTKAFNVTQKNNLTKGYAGLLGQANALETYKGDLSGYTKAEQQAEMSKRTMGYGRTASEAIAQEQAAKASANALAAGRLGARSGTDLMSLAMLTQSGENDQMLNIAANADQQRMQMRMQADQNLLATLGQTAGAQMQMGQAEFQSRLGKQNTILGLGQNQLGAEMDLAANAFAQEQAASAAIANASAAMWGGGADILSSIGTGLTGYASQEKQMQNYLKMRGSMAPVGALPA